MLVADEYLGHRDDPAVAARLSPADGSGDDQIAAEGVHRVVLSETDRRRSRVRTETAAGRDLGVLVARDLADGDVLATRDGDLVVVSLATVDALVCDFSAASVSTMAALRLGHALGNRHWELAVRGEEALFPVPDTRERAAATVEPLVPPAVAVRFEAVSPAVFDEPSASGAGHGSDVGAGHGHSHDAAAGHGHSHSHRDEDGHSHASDRVPHDDTHDHDHDHNHADGRGDGHSPPVDPAGGRPGQGGDE
jgi:urease accessory protein